MISFRHDGSHAWKRPSPPWPTRTRRHRQPRRKTHGRPLLAAQSRPRPDSPPSASEIEDTLRAVKDFARQVHAGTIRGARGPFKNLLVIGIGGSALGPQFVANALSQPATDKLSVYFFDNTDPDGMDKVLSRLNGRLGETLCVVISKSGGTQETRNGMLEAAAAYQRAGLDFGRHAVAVTGVGQQSGQICGGQSLAGAVSDVGLGWRANQRDFRRGPACRWRCKALMWTLFSKAPVNATRSRE